ncbi:pyridine nucleotide-disulfide oxidoreductase, partial [Clavibacter michiganensis subsp. insidiosus]
AAEAPACGGSAAAVAPAAPGPGSDRRPIASPVRLGELAAAYERLDAGPPSLAAAAPGADDPREHAPPTTPASLSTTDRKDTP